MSILRSSFLYLGRTAKFVYHAKTTGRRMLHPNRYSGLSRESGQMLKDRKARLRLPVAFACL